MKNTNKKDIQLDPMVEARKGKYFVKYSKEARDRIKLAVEIYNTREAMGMSQQKLAKIAETTQKVISRIESGDVNIGINLLNRIASALNFDYRNWGNIFNFNNPSTSIYNMHSTANNNYLNITKSASKMFTYNNHN
jgi:transcriptional regulator with XRE-family HTH domain